MEDWIACRLALLFADKRGRVVMGSRMRDRATRVALFLDLVLRDRLLDDDDEGGGIDTAPTGFGPADTFLRYVEQHPQGTVHDAFVNAPIKLRDVLSRDAGRRFGLSLTVDPAASAAERTRSRALAEQVRFDDPADATLVAIVDAIGLLEAADIDAVIAQCGPAASVVVDCRTHLIALKDGLGGISGLLSSSQGA